MSSSIQYETPENVGLEYRTAGLGTRFVAWFIDGILINVLMFVMFIALIFLAAATGGILRDAFETIFDFADESKPGDPSTAVLYAIGIGMLLWAFGSFVYYSLSELLMRGQTFGKKRCKLRVVKTEGFALDTPSILIRNIFRVIDHMPPMWIVPVVSKDGRRLGDMAAGTVVVSDEAEQLSSVRHALAERPAATARFRFDRAALGKLTPQDFEVVDKLLDRWDSLSIGQRFPIVASVLNACCGKMEIEHPPVEDRREFLEDLLAAEYRRQDRRLK